MRLKEDSEEYEIWATHRAATDAFFEANGRYPTSKDDEYWEISEVYKKAHQKIIDIRIAAEKKAAYEAAKLEENPVTSSRKIVVERMCKKGCGNIIVPSGKPGRPATVCEECRNKPKKKRAVKEVLEVIEA